MRQKQPRIDLIDEQTKHVYGHVLVREQAQRHAQPFTMVFCDAMLALLMTEGRRDESDSRFTLVHMRVLLYLLASVQYSNCVERFVVEIADDLGHDRSTVSRALDVLTERDLIRREGQGIGRPIVFHLHPTLAFRGKAGQRAAVLRERWPDLRLPAAIGRVPRRFPDMGPA